MRDGKNGDLMTAFLLYMMRCAHDGDKKLLKAMNVGREELKAAYTLGFDDLRQVAYLDGLPLDVRLKPDIYWSILDRVRESKATESFYEALMRAQAPQELMLKHFGFCKDDYTQLRKALGLPAARGRPCEVDEKTEHRIWYLWKDALQCDGEISPEAYLQIHQTTQVPIRMIWMLAQRWREEFRCVRPPPPKPTLNS